MTDILETDILETAAPATATAADLADDDRRDRLVERMLGSLLAGAELVTVDLGRRLGLYRVLHEFGDANAAELADRADIAPRYSREWLEQQATAGLIDVTAAATDPDLRRYGLPAGHIPVLLDPEHPAHLLGAAPTMTGFGRTLDDVVRAYRTGTGVSFADYGAELRHGIASVNRPGYTHDIGGWVATLPDIHDRLTLGGRILDAGCGVGWSSIGLARAFPSAHVDAVDLDPTSIAEARDNAAGTEADARIEFTVGDAAAPDPDTEPYDLICVLEALHDMSDPIGALAAFRPALTTGGAVLVADEKTADEFTPNGDETERLQFAFSVLHCLPATMHEGTGTANGTVLRSSTLTSWAGQAGFSCTTLPVEHPFWRFYRLDAI